MLECDFCNLEVFKMNVTDYFVPKPSVDLNGKGILITGGTGSFGQAFVRRVLKRFKPSRLVIFSRDEQKQAMAQSFPPDVYPNLRFLLEM